MKTYNYFELNELVKSICNAHPLINDYFVNKYRINDSDNINYPVVSFTVNTIRSQENILTFNVNMLYADRLTDRRDNEITVQSTGTGNLIEIINAIRELAPFVIQDNYSITPFTEQFADNCAGVFATFDIHVPHYLGECHWIKKVCVDCTE